MLKISNSAGTHDIGLYDGSTSASWTYVDVTKRRIVEDIPIDSIVPYFGAFALIPPHWKLCDGRNHTVDLRNKFVIGATVAGDLKKTGGSTTALTPAHVHSAKSAEYSHSHTVAKFSVTSWHSTTHKHAAELWAVHYVHAGRAGHTGEHGHGGGDFVQQAKSLITHTWTDKNTQDYHHTHTVSTGGFRSGSGGSHNHSVSMSAKGTSSSNANVPPYYKLAYIQKKSEP